MRLRPASGRLLLFGLPPRRLSRNPPKQQLPQRELQEDLGLLLRRPLLPVHRMHLGEQLQVRTLQVFGGMEHPPDLLAPERHMSVFLLLLVAMAGFAQLFSP